MAAKQVTEKNVEMASERQSFLETPLCNVIEQAYLVQSPPVTIIVNGPASYSVPRDLLERYSKVCKEALKKATMELNGFQIDLPQCDATGFALAKQWMYTGTLTSEHIKDSEEPKSEYRSAVRAYVTFFKAAEILGLVGYFGDVEANLKAIFLDPDHTFQARELIDNETFKLAFSSPPVSRSVQTILASAFVKPCLEEMLRDPKHDGTDPVMPTLQLLKPYDALSSEVLQLMCGSLSGMSLTTTDSNSQVNVRLVCPATRKSFTTGKFLDVNTKVTYSGTGFGN